MINGKTISLGNIIWKVMRNPLASELTYEQAAEFALEFIRLVNAPLTYNNTTKKLELNNYKTVIPHNVINVRGIRYLGEDGCQDPIAMRYATDLYHHSNTNFENDYENDLSREYTYTLQNCVITTSRKKGFLEISYQEISLDQDGFPLVPDNESFKYGLEYFILHRYVEPLWMMGKIQDKVFQYLSQQRDWYLGQADTSTKLQGIDHLESMMNSLNRIIIQDQSHETFYKNFGQKEYIKRYH
jgi:hypothetical protein